jgi:hypothetical protein
MEVKVKKRLAIVQINDLHGYIEPHSDLVRSAEGEKFENVGWRVSLPLLTRSVPRLRVRR